MLIAAEVVSNFNALEIYCFLVKQCHIIRTALIKLKNRRREINSLEKWKLAKTSETSDL